MAFARGSDPADRGAGAERGIGSGTAASSAGPPSPESAAAGAGNRRTDPEKPGALDEKPAHASRHAARPAAGLAQHLYLYEEFGGVASHHARRWFAHRHRSSVDRGNVDRAAFSRME